jgi:TRAP-type C4-dicarboxylate transport system substrate-binding protein
MLLKKAIPAVLVCAGMAAAAPASAQTTLTVMSYVPSTHLLTRSLAAWGQDVEKATNGRLKFNVLPKAVTAPAGFVDATRDGLVDIAVTVHGYTPGRFVLTKVAEFPALGDSAEVSSVAYQRIHLRHLAKGNEHKGVHVLTVSTHGPGQIYNTRKDIQTVEDLVGMKFRVGGGVVNDVANRLGMSALLKPAPESYELLSQGVVDGTLFPAEAIVSFKLEKVIKHVTLVPGGLYNISMVTMMNEERYNKLSAQDRQILDSLAGEKMARHIGKYWDEGDRVGMDAMKANGVKTVNASPAFMKNLMQKTSTLEEQWSKEAQAKGVDGTRALADFREEIKKVAAAK